MYNQGMNTTREQFLEICRQFPLRLVMVFGSRAAEMVAFLRGEKESMSVGGSDVDVAVLGKSALSVEQKVTLGLALESLLGVERVDLFSLGECDPFLAANAIRGERLFAEDSDDADEYELYVLRRAGDLAELERERMALILREETPRYDAG